MCIYLKKVSWQSVFKNVQGIEYNYSSWRLFQSFNVLGKNENLKTSFVTFGIWYLSFMATTGSGHFTEDQVLLQVDVQ